MTNDSSRLIDKELNRIERASTDCKMCRLHEAREVLDKNEIYDLRAAAFAAVLKDRGRRLTIGNLYMAVAFLVGCVLYLLVSAK